MSQPLSQAKKARIVSRLAFLNADERKYGSNEKKAYFGITFIISENNKRIKQWLQHRNTQAGLIPRFCCSQGNYLGGVLCVSGA